MITTENLMWGSKRKRYPEQEEDHKLGDEDEVEDKKTSICELCQVILPKKNSGGVISQGFTQKLSLRPRNTDSGCSATPDSVFEEIFKLNMTRKVEVKKTRKTRKLCRSCASIMKTVADGYLAETMINEKLKKLPASSYLGRKVKNDSFEERVMFSAPVIEIDATPQNTDPVNHENTNHVSPTPMEPHPESSITITRNSLRNKRSHPDIDCCENVEGFSKKHEELREKKLKLEVDVLSGKKHLLSLQRKLLERKLEQESETKIPPNIRTIVATSELLTPSQIQFFE